MMQLMQLRSLATSRWCRAAGHGTVRGQARAGSECAEPDADLAGRSGVPSSRVNTRPVSVQAEPQAIRSASCALRQATSAAAVPPSTTIRTAGSPARAPAHLARKPRPESLVPARGTPARASTAAARRHPLAHIPCLASYPPAADKPTGTFRYAVRIEPARDHWRRPGQAVRLGLQLEDALRRGVRPLPSALRPTGARTDYSSRGRGTGHVVMADVAHALMVKAAS
jgi:hypothetical protein